MALGWFANLASSKAHFLINRPPINTPWELLTDDAIKTRMITYSYNRLYFSPQWTLPTYAGATPAQLEILQLALMEMAIYVATHLAGEDRRKGLQAQGVVQAGIVKEAYDKDFLDKLPIPATVIDLLTPFSNVQEFYAMNIDRNEEADVKEDVTEF